MIAIAAITGTTVTEYPLHPGDIRLRDPAVSLPAVITADNLPSGYVPVVATDPPTASRWQTVSETTPVLIDGAWRQQWQIADLPVTLTDKIGEIKRDADIIAKHKRDAVVADISAAEMASWPIKRAEAMAYQTTGNTADAPNLILESLERGITLNVLVAKIMDKTALFSGLEAAIAGRCGAIQDAAAAVKNDAELLTIDLNAGWPV